MSRSACGPCPWPSEMACIRLSMSTSVAYRMMVDMGSAPAERTNTSGVALVASGKTLCRSSGGCSMYSLPSSMATNSWIPSITFSGRKALMTISLCQLLNAPNSPGSVTSHGCSASSTACHASGAAARTLGRLANASTRLDIVQRRTHVDCSKAEGEAGNEASSTMPAPTRKSAHSASEISPALRLIAVAIMKEKVILCSPKSPRDTLL
mmetsp:Transcript_29053/g.63642  ORF Transcript_29053/g.63642 Transcript_29053/m.63642 type:complete len:209 (+) Transcript_29053:2059-2685(+)